MTVTAKTDDERFQNGAQEYATYLKTPEGRLRSDLAFANLEDFLPGPGTRGPLRALDIGGGTGVTAVRLASLGIHVTLLDSSPAMLEIAKRAAEQAGVQDRVALEEGDATRPSPFPAASFDVVLCHNLLEYLDEPAAVLRGAARTLRGPSAVLSVLVRNRAGEVLKAALQSGDLEGAKNNLTAEWGRESLYGGKVRLFTPDSIKSMMEAASLTTIAERGVRVVADYLPERVSRSASYGKIFDLERRLGQLPDFAAIARYTQCFARRLGPMTEDAA